MEATNSVPLDAGSAPEKQAAKFDLRSIVRSPAFLPGVVLLAAMILLNWPLMLALPTLWMSEDGYYSHGFLVPLICAYVIYRWWPRLSSIPVAPSNWALVPLIISLWLVRTGSYTEIDVIQSVAFLAVLLSGIALVAGWRWMRALTLPVLYLIFALPMFTMLIQSYTNPLQIMSTKVAYRLLQVLGMQPYQAPGDVTTIYLSNFTMSVEIPCSGLKLLLALMAFTSFFMLIANLKWWGNVIMALLVIPLSVFINGLRIALVGIVGDKYGTEAGLSFHDYSGYITLIICFFILFKIARWLGWRD